MTSQRGRAYLGEKGTEVEEEEDYCKYKNGTISKGWAVKH